MTDWQTVTTLALGIIGGCFLWLLIMWRFDVARSRRQYVDVMECSYIRLMIVRVLLIPTALVAMFYPEIMWALS